MRVVFFGTPDCSVAALDALNDSEFDILAVVTQPDKTKGRNRKKLLPPPVKTRALELGYEVLQPYKVRDESFLAKLKKYNADVFCVFAFGQIFPEKLLKMPKFGCFNAHASLLPKLRGAAPVNWSIINGDKKSGMTIQKMGKGMDTGPVCWTSEILLDDRETDETLMSKMMPLAGAGLLDTLRKIEAEKIEFIEQNHEDATYAAMLDKSTGFIDWSWSATKIDRIIRGIRSWPTASAVCESFKVKLYEATPKTIHEYKDCSIEAPIGTILKTDKQGIHVKCGEGVLVIHELQREGKKRMNSQQFVCGSRLCCGNSFSNICKN